MSGSSYIWLEGVDFGQHIDDTNQIAVIRGSSIALLEVGDFLDDWLTEELAPDNIIHTKIFTGASLTLFWVDCDEARANEIASDMRLHLAGYGLIEKSNPHDADLFKNPKFPFAYLRFVTGVAPVDPANQAGSIRLAHFRAREAQATGDYVPPVAPDDAEGAMCGMSRSRPADFYMPLTPAQVQRMALEADTNDDAGNKVLKVSRSVAARRYYGRRARSLFFKRRFSENKEKPDPLPYGFVNDLHELVTLGDGAENVTLPIQVANKMAVFYADGNGFTKIREQEMGGDEAALVEFDKKVREALEDRFLKGLLSELYERTKKSDGQTNDAVSTRFHSAAYNRADDEPGDDPDKGKPRLRFELLMYGGDEIAFVAPAWLGIEIAQLFFKCVKGTEAGGHDLTFKAGLALVNYKMPIREARQLAHDLAEFARREEGGKPVNSITIQAFESVEPPANGLPQLHNSLWGTKADEGYDETLRDVVKLTPDELRGLSDMVLAMKKGGFARSQLYNMLKAAQWEVHLEDGKVMRLKETKLATTGANKRAEAVFNSYKDRMSPDIAKALADYLGDQKKAAMRAWLLTHIWDYVDAMKIAQDTGADATPKAAAS